MEKIKGFFGQYRWLSNFWPCKITYEGIEYPTAEHAYQAAKTNDPDVRMAISKIKTPGGSKKAGRNVVLRNDWENIKFLVMEEILRLKFAIPEFEKLLLDTDDSYLEETNFWHDVTFGVCDGKSCKKSPHQSVGENMLGKILMKIRNEKKTKNS